MSFSGDLEHLPLVDIIQLLHSTRKTGTLCLAGPKGESQIVFDDGYIVGANHYNNNVRIGQVLVEMRAITQEDLEEALAIQRGAGDSRKPLIATLIENGRLTREDAYTGLETLIEMSIVEVLTWKKGSFSLDVHSLVVSDDFRYFPETLKQEIFLNTQSILMDALRIYDEKMRDGTLEGGPFSGEEAAPVSEMTGRSITVDDLGLGILDELDKQIPDVFGGLKDYDNDEIHLQKIRESGIKLAPAEHDQLHRFLMDLSENSSHGTSESRLAVILFSQDRLLRHCLATLCKHEGTFMFATDDEEDLDLIIGQSLSKELVPLMVLDAPQTSPDFTGELLLGVLERKLDRYPQLAALQLISPRDYEFPLRALQAGARSVLSRFGQDEDRNEVNDLIVLLKSFGEYLRKYAGSTEHGLLQLFKEAIFELGTLREVPEVVFIPLKFASTMFERCITLVTGNGEMIAERSFGIASAKEQGPSKPLLFRIPTAGQGVLQDVIRGGGMFYGPSNDQHLKEHLFGQISSPLNPKIMLLPVRNFGRVIAIIYADFGTRTGASIQLDLLDIIARHAGLVLDNNLFRKKFEKPAQAI